MRILINWIGSKITYYKMTKRFKRCVENLEIDRNARNLFIDCGSNLGQGYTFFKRFFPPDVFDAVLIEPNPHCMAYVKKKFGHIKQVRFLESAAWIKEDTLTFFGLTEDERGNTSTGGSVVSDHNSSIYQSDAETSIEVPAFSFSEFLSEEKEKYDMIIVKMDIESAEYEVLQDLIKKGTIDTIYYLIVEFHADYFKEEIRQRYIDLEEQLTDTIRGSGVGLTVWH